MRQFAGVTIALAMVAACTDQAETGLDRQLTVRWLEWPTAVTGSSHGSVRVTGFMGCGSPVVRVTKSGPSSLSVMATEHYNDPHPPPCPPTIYILNAVVPLPPLEAPAGSTGQFTIDAWTTDAQGAGVRRVFGVLQLSDVAPDTTVQAGGRVLLMSDSLGCSWAKTEMLHFVLPGYGFGPWVLSNDLALGSDWRVAFVSGEYSAALSPRCGHNSLLQLREVELAPGN